MDDMQIASFKIISAVGMAKSYYIEAIRSSENGDFEEATEKLKKGKEAYKEGHAVHFKLIQGEASGASQEVTILLAHAEGQLMSTEIVQIMAEQMVKANRRIYDLEHR